MRASSSGIVFALIGHVAPAAGVLPLPGDDMAVAVPHPAVKTSKAAVELTDRQRIARTRMFIGGISHVDDHIPPGEGPRIVRWDPITTRTGQCCWNRARQSCSQHNECDLGGEGCVSPGHYTKRYGPAVCTPPPAAHIAYMQNGGNGPEVARQIAPTAFSSRSAEEANGPTFLFVDAHGSALSDSIRFVVRNGLVPSDSIYYFCMFAPGCRGLTPQATVPRRKLWTNVVSGVHEMVYDGSYPGALSYVLHGNTMLPLLHMANVSAATGFRLPLNDFVARMHAWARVRDTRADPIANVGVCHAGAELCLALEPFVDHIIVRASHRFDFASCGAGASPLQLGGPQRWHTGFQTGRMIQRAATSAHHTVAATTAYDAAYIYHNLGVRPWFWPLSASKLDVEYNPNPALAQMLVIVPNLPSDAQSLWRNWLTEGMATLRQQDYIMNVPNTFHGKVTLERLLQHSVAISIPNQIGNLWWHDLYRMGMPMFAPSLRLYARLHQEYGLLSDRCCEMQPHCPLPCYRASDFDSAGLNDSWVMPPQVPGQPSKEIRLPLHTSKTLRSTMAWLALHEQYTYPYIEYFDTFAGLARRLKELTPEELRERSDLQRTAARSMDIQTEQSLRMRFKELTKAGPAQRLQAYGGEVPVGLPRCAFTHSERTNFREYGQWYGM